MYNAQISRKGGTLRGTKQFGDHEVFASFNYYNTKTFNEGAPGSFTGQTAAGGRNVSVTAIFLPVYVCPQGTRSSGPIRLRQHRGSGHRVRMPTPRDAVAVLNPNNPFAAQGQFGAALGAASPSRS